MYKRIEELRKKPIIKTSFTKAEIGESMTIPNQSMSLKEIVERSIRGFPVPMQRQEIRLPDDINNIIQGTDFDIVSDAKFRRMSRVERERYVNNVRGLKQGISEKFDQALKQKEELKARLDLQQATQQATQTTSPTQGT